MKLHRTSSTRKQRRKNDVAQEWSGLQLRSSLKESESLAGSSSSQVKDWSLDFKRAYSWICSHFHRLLLLCLGILCASAYYYHVSTLFENTTRFSLLTNAERELSLPTDVAFRYTFFKKIATSETWFGGMRKFTSDGENITASSFHRYSLGPEVIYATVFHFLKTIGSVVGTSGGRCTSIYQESNENTRQAMSLGTRSDPYASGSSFPGSLNRMNHGETHQSQYYTASFNSTCSGLGNPLEFYLTFTWVLEAAAVVLLFFTALRTSQSVLGGLSALALFVVLHPQRTNYHWLFPSLEKIGWIFSFIQIYTVGQTVFYHVHPSWKAAPKIAMATTLLILVWNTDSQWFLLTQLLIITIMHLFGYCSRYVTALILFGQFTGWQYASLVSLDPSMHHWSLYSYAFLATLVTVFMIEPVIDWILGDKSTKWSFMRRTILVLVFQISLCCARCDIGRYSGFLEDVRFPLSLTSPEEGYELLKNDSIQHPGTREFDADEVVLAGGNTIDASVAKLELFLQLCFLSRMRSTPWKFFCKYFLLILGGVYATIVALIVPIAVLKVRYDLPPPPEGFKAISRKFVPTQWKAWTVIGKEEKEGGEKLLQKSILSSLRSLDFGFSAISSLAFQIPFLNNDTREELTTCGLEKYFPWIYQEHNESRRHALQIYIALQAVAFALLAIFVDKRWEMFFVPLVCVIISFLCDFKRIKAGIGALPIQYLHQLHMGIFVCIIGIILASARVRSNMMHLQSRGRFEIGNPQVSQTLEAIRWAEENLKFDSRIVGPDNLMVAMSMLTAKHKPQFHHLTAHSWANKQETTFRAEKTQGKASVYTTNSGTVKDSRGKGLDKLKPIGERWRAPSSPVLSSRESLEEENDLDLTLPKFDRDNKYRDFEKPSGRSNSMEEEKEHEDSVESDPRMTQLNGEDATKESRAQALQLSMTSRLEAEDILRILKVYSMYSRRLTKREFHQRLTSMQITHLVLSEQLCSSGKTVAAPKPIFAKSTNFNASPSLNALKGQANPQLPVKKAPTSILQSSQGGGKDGLMADQLIFQREEITTRNLSGSQWQWEWNWQKPLNGENGEECQTWNYLSPIPALRLCDLTHFWDLVEEVPHHKPKPINDRVNAIKNSVRGGVSWKKFKGVQPSLVDESDEEKSEKSQEATDEEPLICRLLSERNVLPFTKVFQNSMITILSTGL